MIFNYNTLNVFLESKTRSLRVELNRPQDDNRLNIEMLFELEGLLGWLTAHLEINAVVFTGSGDIFCQGFSKEELSIISEEKLRKYIVRLQKLVSAMLALPQTIICDLKDGAAGMGIELALGSDIRIARNTCKLSFNALQEGWVPTNGGIGLLSQWVGHATARDWQLSSRTVYSRELNEKSFIQKIYSSEENSTTSVLERILKQSPVARIQAKRSFLEVIMPELSRAFDFEPVFSFASMKSGDWKSIFNENESFKSARDMAQEVKNGPHLQL